MIELTEIEKVQNQGDDAENEVRKAEELVIDLIEFLCCNKFMRLFRFLFRKKFDEQYDKLSEAHSRLITALKSLDNQWDLLEDYWEQKVNEDLEES